ncbi:hypothetical protein CCAX7_26360 [Capsulimonas corticalis]|uniref:Uncharacterized protein n=1 Tax=Capsulimonas corticalis TaxID=2219043 RepID=A0A402D6K5_9BACT|nr:recombinase family protein [Capsulimonas corticalis]BDI30585.1 hypothetical protein CCAX7_26360 [Capsulimonas corticalis]
MAQPDYYVPSIDAIIKQAKALKLSLATQLMNGGFEEHCSLPIVKSLNDGGHVVDLELIDGKYAAIYVRVSTDKQREDGWSVEDQLRRNIAHCIRKQWAFKIYSDQTLSGSYAWLDSELQKKMAKDRALRYKQTFTKIFLDDASPMKITSSQRRQMEEFLDKKIVDLEEATVDFSDENETGATEYDDDKPDYTGGRHRKLKVRPGLTLLLSNDQRIHTVVVTDLSRLCRSTTLFGELGRILADADISVEGTIERLDYIKRDADMAHGLQGAVFSWFAAIKLQEVVANAIRGISQMLMNGRPHGQVTFWMERNDDGFAHLIEERVRAVRRVIELAWSPENLGYREIAYRMNKEGWQPPRGSRWNGVAIRTILRRKNLMGAQTIFGLDWPVLPAIIDAYDYDRLQQHLATKSEEPIKKSAYSTGYLLTGILRCSACNTTVRFTTNSGVEIYLCQCEKSVREETRDKRHFRLLRQDADRFFNDLMRSYGRNMVKRIQEDPLRQRLLDEIGELNEQVKGQQSLRQERISAATSQAQSTLANIAINPENPQFEIMLQQITTTLLNGMCQTQHALEQRLRMKRADLDRLDQTERPLTTGDRIAQWDQMDDRAKNRIMRQLISQVTLLEIGANEVLEIRLNLTDDNVMPHVPVNREYRGRQVRRRLPSVAEYIAHAYALTT